MKLFQCQGCGQLLYFESFVCDSCGRRLGYLPNDHDVTALEPQDGCWRALGAPGALYRLCANAEYNACNWLLPGDGTDTLCIACQCRSAAASSKGPLSGTAKPCPAS